MIVVVAFAQGVVPKAFCSELGGCVEESGDEALEDAACVEGVPVVYNGGEDEEFVVPAEHNFS